MAFAPKDRLHWGQNQENDVATWLEKQGYRILERRKRFRRGEIDLIAEVQGADFKGRPRGWELVFIEVRARSDGDALDPIEVLGQKKLRSWRWSVERWLSEQEVKQQVRYSGMRMDFVSVVGEKITHYPNVSLGPTSG